MKSIINDLHKKIIKHRSAYYNDQPIISDAAFDALCDELRGLDPDNDALTAIGSPIDVNSEWEKATHEIPMGSLDKASTPKEFETWALKSFKPGNSVFITEKLDGLSIELIYTNGKLTSAITRGNGDIGEQIIRNVEKMQGVKSSIPKFSGSLRGEIILTKENHKKYFSDFANTRNAATGIAKRLDGIGSEHLNVLIYQAICDDDCPDSNFKSEFHQFEYIKLLGLDTPKYDCFVPKKDFINEICKYVNIKWQEYMDARDKSPYDLDGMVVRLNDLIAQIALGEKDLRPLGAIAYKFTSEQARSTIKKIVCQTGNTGRITPVGEFEPVNLMGAKIERASLYNFGYIKDIGVDIGSEVIISRRGDVIPRIEEVIKGTGTFLQPLKNCPACGGSTEMFGENLMCVSSDTCPAQRSGRIIHWLSSLNILEWGDKLVDKLIESGKVENIVDIYKLSIKDLSDLDRMGERSATKCYESLWQHNPISLELFLGSLCIPLIGTSTIKMLTDSGFDSLDKIFAGKTEDFSKVDGLGPKKSDALVNGLHRNKTIINDLLNAGLQIKDKVHGVLSGKKIAITGSTNIKRADLINIINNNGGEYAGSIGKSCTHLIIADPDSRSVKAVSARNIGIKLLSEDGFLKLCNS